MSYYGKKPPPPAQYAPTTGGGYVPVRPPRKGLPTFVILLLVFGGIIVIAAGVVAVFGGGSNSGSSSSAGRDVLVSECTSNEFTGPEATLSVTNSTSSAKDYIIKVDFLDGSTRLGSRTVTVNDLGPGMTEKPRAVAFRPTSSSTFRCVITDVTRF